MCYICNGKKMVTSGKQNSKVDGFLTMFGMIFLAIFLTFSCVLQQRCNALLQLSYAQEKVSIYTYLLHYIKTVCIAQEETTEEEMNKTKEWIVLQNLNSYRIVEDVDTYRAYHGMKCILCVWVDEDDQIKEIDFGENAQKIV